MRPFTNILLFYTMYLIATPGFGQQLKSVGTPDVEESKPSELTNTWTLYEYDNSLLPANMTRTVAVDLHKHIWIGTDNGIVKIDNGEWQLFTSENTGIAATAYDPKKMEAVRDMAIDYSNNKWFIVGWDVYKYDDGRWTKYDSTNSPIKWARTIFVDKANQVWFTSWEGIAKFDGNNWSIFNTENTDLPTNKVLGVFWDSKERLWIGTFEGNIMVSGDKITQFADIESSPLSKASIFQVVEDSQGNLWFNLHPIKKNPNAGIYVLSGDQNWRQIRHENPNIFAENSINDFLLDEEKGVLWVALNNIGLLRYDIAKEVWETYTNQNSNVPSIHVMKLMKDGDGFIWAATLAGVIKINK